jgi:AP-4 complex subunit beta-1
LSYTQDLITKKMIFLYLTTYAENNASLAIMSINCFVKDINHKDFKIRGLALRNLCSLRFKGIVDYAKPHALAGLNDDDPYVRKTAIIGCVKLSFIDSKFAEDNNIVDTLYDMIKDPSTIVVLSAINALNELMVEAGGMAVNEPIIVYLINRLKDFDEFG